MRLFRWFFYAWLLVVAITFTMSTIRAISGPDLPENAILTVNLNGPMTEAQSPGLLQMLMAPDALSLMEVTYLIRAAAEDERIKGLVLKVQRPELGLAQLQDFESAMATFRKSGKWSRAFLVTAGEFGNGIGPYAAAISADTVTLTPPGDLNLLGLRAEVPFMKGTFQKLGVDTYFEQRYEYKNAVNTFTHDAMTPPHREAVAALVNELQAELVTHLAARRGVEPAVAQDWLANGPHDARTAKELGLVDDLAYWDAVHQEAKDVSGNDEPYVSLGLYRQAQRPRGGLKTVAVVTGAGPVVVRPSNDNPLEDTQEMAASELQKAFAQAREDAVQALVFRVDSPGGSYIASDLIRREVELTRNAGIPVVVSMGNLAASGGYFVSMQADAIFAQPTTLTGSIGVYFGMFGTEVAFKRWLGVTFDSYQTLPNADLFSGLRVPNQDQRRKLSAMVDRIYQDFVNKAADGRSKSPDEMHKLAKGRVWTGRAALENGLVDALGGLDAAVQKAKELAELEEDVALKVYPPPKDPIQALQELLGGGNVQVMPTSPMRALRDFVQQQQRGVLQLPFGIRFD